MREHLEESWQQGEISECQARQTNRWQTNHKGQSGNGESVSCATLGTAYSQLVVAGSELASINKLHGANSTSQSPLSAHPTSPPEVEFTVRSPGAPCTMQEQPRHQSHLTSIACNRMTKI